MTADLHKLSAGRCDYYVREVARDHEEYLSGHGESPGNSWAPAARRWASRASAQEEFRRLFAWRTPTPVSSSAAPRSDAMPAWDLVLRPVKDVAILVYALGDQRTSRAARDAHQAGVEAAVSYLDGQVGTRTGRDGAKHVAGSGLVAVGFTHRVSRGGDPLPHTHLVIVNRTQGPDGQWRTLDSRDLLAHRQAADAIYRATYQTSCAPSGSVGGADRWGNRAIVGMPPELVKAFSKRHEQISAELERLEREEGKPRTGKLIQYVAMRPGRPRPTTPPRPCTAAGSRKPASTATSPSGWWPRSPTAPNASRRWTAWPSRAHSTSSPPRRPDRECLHLRPPRGPGRPRRPARRHRPRPARGPDRPVPGRAGHQRHGRPDGRGAPLDHPRAAHGRAAAAGGGGRAGR